MHPEGVEPTYKISKNHEHLPKKFPFSKSAIHCSGSLKPILELIGCMCLRRKHHNSLCRNFYKTQCDRIFNRSDAGIREPLLRAGEKFPLSLISKVKVGLFRNMLELIFEKTRSSCQTPFKLLYCYGILYSCGGIEKIA
jgi:hypothetical protein